MATANQLEEILNSDVDENKILSLVGSLESKLASPTVREPAGQNSTVPLNSNHIGNAQIVSTLPHMNQSAKLMTNESNTATVTNVNGSKLTVSQPHLIGTNSIITSSITTTNATSRTVNVNASFSHPNAGSSSGHPQNQTGHLSGIDIKPLNEIKREPNIQINSGYVKQEFVTVGSTNTGTVSFPNASTTVVRTVLGNNVQGTVNNSHGSGAIYDLANIAAEQKPLSVQALKAETKPVFTTLAPGSIPSLPNTQQKDIKHSGQSFILNVVGSANVQNKQPVVQTVVKHEANQVQTPGKIHVHSGISQQGIKQEVKFVSPQTVYSQPNVPGHAHLVSSQTVPGSIANAVLKSTILTPGSTPTVITRTTKPMSSPQTVTVLRSPATSHTTAVPQSSQTIQIVNLNNSRLTMAAPTAARAPGSALHKPLAPSIMTASGTQVKIAPQTPQMALPMRPGTTQNVGGTNLVLPPNMQLPPGTMLVKNEQGQLMIVSSPQQPQTFKVQTRPPQVPQTTIASHLQHVVTAAPAARTLSAPHVSLQGVPRQVVSAQAPPIQQRPSMMSPAVSGGAPVPRPVLHQPLSGVSHATNQPPMAGSGSSQGILESVKKCKNFLSTLLKLASQSNQPPQTIRNVKELIQGLVDGRVAPELFTAKLQVELKSSPQPYLVPFLKKSLPLLRQSLVLNKMHIDGVRAPPQEQNATGNIIASTVITNPSGQAALATTVPHVITKPHQSSASEVAPQLRTIVKQSRPSATPKSANSQTKTLMRSVTGSITTSPLHVRPGSSPGSSKVSATSAGHKEKRKYEAINRDDDDINDVATMGGVNLSEESRNILATNSDLMASQLQSCKDENFLHTPSLQCRINALAKKFGLDDVPAEVASLVSHATQERLRTVVEKLSVTTEHRLEIYKTDRNYEVTSDVRPQLKFLEELERMEQKRKDEAEREVLMRVVKSRSKHEDPEHLKLKERAKAMQQAELEDMRQREANRTALAAIGPRKKPKLDGSLGGSSLTTSSLGSGTSSSSTPKTSVLYRPRVKRVNLRDLMFLLEQERETNKSVTLFKSFMK